MKKLLAFCVGLFFLTALQSQIVITEIMYNPPESGTDSLEYIEIHNPGTQAVNLDGWSFSGVDLVFSGVTMSPGQYLLTALRPSAMQAVFGKTAVAWSGGALTNAGETLQLKNASGTVVDEVAYDDGAPWPTDPAGNGYSLELCDVNSDNSLATNWKAANHNTGAVINSRPVYATPGEKNTVSCLPDADHQVGVQDFFFAPANITINQGESIIWVCTQGIHNVNGSKATFPANPEGFSSGAPKAAPWFFIDTFDIPGVYAYRCDPHFSQGMNGKVTVLPKVVDKIVITEFMYNDPGADSLEFVEIYNNGAGAVDLSGWSFTQGIEFVFPSGASLAPGKFMVLAKFIDLFNSKFSIPAAYQFNGALTNTGEDIELRNAAGEVQDYVNYLPTAPWDPAANGTGASLVLCNFDADNSLASSWYAATTPSGVLVSGVDLLVNPGAPSGCPTAIVAEDDNLAVASGQPSVLNVVANDYAPVIGSASVTITVPPQHGTAVANPDRTITYTSTANHCGLDELQYRLSDGTTNDVATVKITVKCYGKYSIPTVTTESAMTGEADSLGVLCELTSVVYGVNLRANLGLNFTIIDGQNNGINVFRNSGSAGYTVKEGDNVTVRGTIDQFRGLTEIIADTILKNSANNPLINPLVVVKPTEATESKLIKINNLHLVDPTKWTTGTGTSGFTVQAVSDAHPLDTVVIRIDNDVELFQAQPPAFPFDLTGIGGQNDLESPFTEFYQILPRYNADLKLIVGTDEADFSSAVRVWPNPVADLLKIQTEISFDEIEIYTPEGRLAKRIAEPDLEEVVDFQSFGSGVFFLKFEKDGLSWMTRVVRI